MVDFIKPIDLVLLGLFMRNLYEYKGDIYVYDYGWSYDINRPTGGQGTNL